MKHGRSGKLLVLLVIKVQELNPKKNENPEINSGLQKQETLIITLMESSPESIVIPNTSKEKPSRKAQQREARHKKMVEKAKRKIKASKKTERKLAVKSERVKANKRENSKRKLVKKIQAREAAGTLKKTDTQVSKTEKKPFIKDNFGIPQKK